MFIYQNQLEHLLSPRDYFDPAVFEREMENLLRPGWHFLVTRAELPRPGDFMTLDLFGEPLLVRNIDGEVHAYLNVCAHRHCRLTGKSRGHEPHFRCQYHGWEYTADGHTAKIPEARCFRPFDRENARLIKFRTQNWGDMVFVNLSEAGPGLTEYLGALAQEERNWFAPPFRYAWTWQAEYEANWKIVAENSLESYHIPFLHRKSFGIAPPEETCSHDLETRYTTFCTPETYSWVSRLQNLMVRSLGGAVTNVYRHHHLHPNLIFITMDVMRMAQLIQPLSPTRTRHRVWVYTLDGTRHNPWAWVVRKVLAGFVGKVARQILLEDAPIFPEVQAGLESSRCRGVLGTREERVFAFQKYLWDSRGSGRLSL